MALIVEDGSVVTGANTYANLATVDAYHAALGQDGTGAWDGTDEDKETAILRAMRYLENLNWVGSKTAQGNPLQWPRYETYDRSGYLYASDIVPQPVVNALCEAALVELTSPGALRASTSTSGQIKREKVDVIETEFFESFQSRTSYDAIEDELIGLVDGFGNGGSVSLTRV